MLFIFVRISWCSARRFNQTSNETKKRAEGHQSCQVVWAQSMKTTTQEAHTTSMNKSPHPQQVISSLCIFPTLCDIPTCPTPSQLLEHSVFTWNELEDNTGWMSKVQNQRQAAGGRSSWTQKAAITQWPESLRRPWPLKKPLRENVKRITVQ